MVVALWPWGESVLTPYRLGIPPEGLAAAPPVMPVVL